jgi:cytochrome c peroxidase
MRRTHALLAAAAAVAVAVLVVARVAAHGDSLPPKERLGKAIFFDESLSLNKNQSCASCHDPAAGWTGPDSEINAHGAVYEGSIPDAFGDRKPPSAAYATQSPVLSVDGEGLFVGGNFWDGRATGEKLGNPAADQAQGPFLNPKEQALPDSACVVHRVCAADYPGVSFARVWGASVCRIHWPSDIDEVCGEEDGQVALSDRDRAKSDRAYDQIALSIAVYEASPEVNAFTSKFDHARRGMAKLSHLERRGWALFRGKGQCAKCHVANGQKPLFTDYTFDNLGVPKNPENPVYDENPGFVDRGLGGFLETRPDYAAYADDNMGKHKVPTLRNVDKGSPGIVKAFAHNGYFKSLEGIVHFYNTRDVKPVCPGNHTEAQALADDCWPEPEVAANVNDAELGDLGLSEDEEAAIVAFLRTLSDGPVPAERGRRPRKPLLTR